MLNKLEQRERKVYSQNGEDGVIEAIFEAIGTTNRYFVEFGCGDATECNTAYLLENGWQGLLMDNSGQCRNPRATIRQEVITAENINPLFRKYGVPDEFDLLSIDIDGNDYWVWQQINYHPRVVVIEYNAHCSALDRKTIAYDPNFRWSGTDYFGASLAALEEQGREKGYTLVYCEKTGVNAFFVSTRLLPPSFVPSPLQTIYRPPNYGNLGLRHAPDALRSMATLPTKT